MLTSGQQGRTAGGLDAWRHHISEVFAPTEVFVNKETGFRGGSIRQSGLGNITLSRISADAAVLLRTSKAAALTPETDFYKIALQIQGNCLLKQDDREADLSPGDFSLFDARRSFQLTYGEPYRTLLVMLPPKLLPFDEKIAQRIGAVRMSGQHGPEGLLSTFLTRLAGEVDDLSNQSAEGLADSILVLLKTVFSQYVDLGAHDLVTARWKTLSVEIQHYIEQHLDDHTMTPASIAETHNISKRYLHKIFEREGNTVNGQIRKCRLEKVRRDLANPLLTDCPVSVVGARWGLVDPSQLSRLFRDAYGLSPREYRVRAAAGHDGVPKSPFSTGHWS